MKIVNLDNKDYHIHCSNFSDWLNSIDEIVKFAWEIWLTEIAITDHSDVMTKNFTEEFWFVPWTARFSISSWKNVFNDVNVIFWVEADLLNEKWDICTTIQWIESEFIILAAHKWTYKSDFKTVTQGLIKAIERHHKKIKFICHPDDNFQVWEYIEIEKLVEVANKYNIPLEFNWYTFSGWNSNFPKLEYMLKNANELYLNSDAHTLFQLRENRKLCFDYLRENWYVK